MQAVTLEVIMRAVFGVREAERARRACASALPRGARRGLDAAGSMLRRCAALGPDRLGAQLRRFRGALAPVDELLLDEIRARRAPPTSAERDDMLSLLLAGAPRRRHAR